MMLMLILLSLMSSPLMVEGAVVCPSAADYAPCECSEYSYQPGTIFLGCSSKQLTDSRASEILDAFLTTPGVSPLVYLDLQYSQLTRVLSQIKSFPQLERVYIVFNSITSVDYNKAFNFTEGAYPLDGLTLHVNQLTTIAPGSFKGQ